MHSCVTFSYPAGTTVFSVTYILLTFSCWDCIEVVLAFPPGVTSGNRLLYHNLQKWYPVDIHPPTGWRNYPCHSQRWSLMICEQFQPGGPFKTISIFIYSSPLSSWLYIQWLCMAVRSRDLFFSSSHSASLLPCKTSVSSPGSRQKQHRATRNNTRKNWACKRQHDQSRQGASISVQVCWWANSTTSEKCNGQSAYSKNWLSSSNIIFLNRGPDQKPA